MSRLLVIAAGGTGGHMFPAQALAETMLGRGWRVRLSTDARGARYTGAFPSAVQIEQVAAATFARGGLVAKALVGPRLLAGILATLRRFRRDRPSAVVGFGGYPSIPALAAAALMRLPRMIHEQNGVLGRVNRAFARRVSAVACGTWPTPLPAGVEGVHIGNPVRAAILAQAGAPYAAPGDGPLHVLVIGGSQGARALSDFVPGALAALPAPLPDRLRVAHQAREEDLDRVARFYAKAGIAAEVETFFHDVPERMAAAQLSIARAGASTLADLTVIGRPAILIPYPHAAADHQSANARALVEAGGAVLVPESELDIAALTAQVAAILDNPQKAEEMAAAARSQGRPDAAERLADMVERLAEGRSGRL